MIYTRFLSIFVHISNTIDSSIEMEKDTKEKIKGCWLKIKIIQERCVVSAKLGGNKIIQNNACLAWKLIKIEEYRINYKECTCWMPRTLMAGCSYAKISTEYWTEPWKYFRFESQNPHLILYESASNIFFVKENLINEIRIKYTSMTSRVKNSPFHFHLHTLFHLSYLWWRRTGVLECVKWTYIKKIFSVRRVVNGCTLVYYRIYTFSLLLTKRL